FQDGLDRVGLPAAAPLGGHAFPAQVAGDLAQRAAGGPLAEDAADDGCLGGHDPVLVSGLFDGVAVRAGAAVVHDFLGPDVDRSFLPLAALQPLRNLGQRGERLEEQAALVGGAVDILI